MSSIEIDHLGRDELITLLNRVAGRLAILSGNRVSTSTLQTPIIYGYHTHATPGNLPSPFVATNNSWPPWYEEEHDPWNAHLRGEPSASSSGATIRTRQSAAQTAIDHGFCQSAIGDLPTTTRLTDAMTHRYSPVDIQHPVLMRPQADPNSIQSVWFTIQILACRHLIIDENSPRRFQWVVSYSHQFEGGQMHVALL